MHTITTRKPTPAEQQVISALAKPDYASFGCCIFTAAVSAWMLGNVGHWIGSFFSVNVSSYAQWIGWLGGIVCGICLLLNFMPYARKQRNLATLDHQEQLIQEIHVTNPRAIEIAMIGNTGPNLAIDIGDEKILYLQGQWLYDNEIYGAKNRDDDEGDELFNGLPSPHSFPCTDFKIVRLPNSGEVLHIHVTGKYIQPETAVEALKPEYVFQPSELFAGSINDIAAMMQREHENREAASYLSGLHH